MKKWLYLSGLVLGLGLLVGCGDFSDVSQKTEDSGAAVATESGEGEDVNEWWIFAGNWTYISGGPSITELLCDFIYLYNRITWIFNWFFCKGEDCLSVEIGTGR